MSVETVALAYPEKILNTPVLPLAVVASAAGGLVTGFSPEAQKVVGKTDPGDIVLFLARGFDLIRAARYDEDIDPNAVDSYLNELRAAGGVLATDVKKAVPTILDPFNKVLAAISETEVNPGNFAARVKTALANDKTKAAAQATSDYLGILGQFENPRGQLVDDIGKLRVKLAGQSGDGTFPAAKIAKHTRAAAESVLDGRPELGDGSQILGAIATRVVAGLDDERVDRAMAKLKGLSNVELQTAAPDVVAQFDKALAHDPAGIRSGFKGAPARMALGIGKRIGVKKAEGADRKLEAIRAHVEPLLTGLIAMTPETRAALNETRRQIAEFFDIPFKES